MITLRFSALDTWFFRESRPMDAIGGSELTSLFPPSPRTLLGAVRTAIGDAAGVDWHAFALDAQDPLRSRIGCSDDLGALKLAGPWLCEDGERLYPVPLLLLGKASGDATTLTRLRIGEPAQTFLGRVRLPALPSGQQGYKPFEQAWLSKAGLEQVLAGGLPDVSSIRLARDLFREEPRLGIARDQARRTADEGLLYQTRHLRPYPGLALEADVDLSAESIPPKGLVRLGGEGRLAHLAPVDDAPFPIAPKPDGSTRGLILILLTPARLGAGRDSWLPPDFKATDQSDGTRVWTGSIAGIALTLHAAVIGKAQREGGWDLAVQQPRSVQSLLPAGTCWYVSVDGALDKAIAALHQTQLGEDQALGRGLIACALWNDDEYRTTPKEQS